MNCFYQNVRGLNTKIETFLLAVTARDFDIVCITETWLRTDVSSSELFPNGCYNVYRSDRRFDAVGGTRGGGVLVGVSGDIMSERVDLTNFCNNIAPLIDIVCCKITFKFQVLYFFVLYIPPTITFDSFEHFLDQFTLLTAVFQSNVIIVGDFNVPDFHAKTLPRRLGSQRSILVSNFANSFNLAQYNQIFNCNNRLLDLVLSNFNCTVTRSDVPFVTEDLHHPSLEISLPFLCQRIQNFGVNRDSPAAYNFRKADYHLLYTLILEADWSPVYSSLDVNDACAALYEILNGIFNSCVPLKLKRRRRFPVYYSRELINNIYRKEKALRGFKKYKSALYKTNFHSLRSLIKKQIRNDYITYVLNSERNICNDPSNFWAFIGGKKCQSRIPGIMRLPDDTVVRDPQAIVNAFASFFGSTFIASVDVVHPISFCSLPHVDISKVETSQVIAAGKKLKNKLTSGVDGIPSFLVRDSIGVLADPLTSIFNLILSTEQFPNIWKTARISPILKSGDSDQVSNYRPISILCNFSKIFEIILHQSLFNHVKGLISIDQHGFFSGRSCVTNLSCLSAHICESIDTHTQVDVIYTDFQKAFDRIDHYILLNKLSQCGLSDRLINLFRSYLLNRCQFVEFEGFASEKFTATSGVPQGSNLGPLLFILFINDLITLIKCRKLAYADDLKLYLRINTLTDCLFLQSCLNDLEVWCIENRLGLNAAKCNVVSYSRSRSPFIHNYFIDNIVLNRLDQITDLGITFDTEFNFIPHISNIVSSALKRLGFIIRNTESFTLEDTFKLLFFCFVRSKLEYGCTIWNPLYQCHIDLTESVQRRFAKYLAYRLDGTYPARGCNHRLLLDRFNLVPLQLRRNIFLIKCLHSIINGLIDSPVLLSGLSFLVPRLNNRHPQAFFLPAPRSNILFRSPLYAMCSLFNKICHLCDINGSPVRVIVGAVIDRYYQN